MKNLSVIVGGFLLVVLMHSCCKKDDDNSIKDGDGNVYTSVQIGTQVWLVENLKTIHYNDGEAIPLVTDNIVWGNLTTPAYCWYNNDAPTYKNIYGALYNWYAVNTGKLCPKGWHVPTDSEWTTLTTYLGGERIAGGKLKEPGTTHWDSPNTGATNETGFTALPGGYRENEGPFNFIGYWSVWWSASELFYTTGAWAHFVTAYDRDVQRDDCSVTYGFSVRCVKD